MTFSLNTAKLTAKSLSDAENSNNSDPEDVRWTIMHKVGSLSLKPIVVCIMKMALQHFFFLSNQETPSSKTTVIAVDTICRYYVDTLFGKKVFLGILQNSQESTYARVSLIIKLQAQACNFIKKETLAQVFSCEFCEISKNTFSNTTTLVADSEKPQKTLKIFIYKIYNQLYIRTNLKTQLYTKLYASYIPSASYIQKIRNL